MYFEKDPSTSIFPTDIVTISAQNDLVVGIARNNHSLSVNARATKFVKPQGTKSAYRYGYLVYACNVPVADAAPGQTIGYIKVTTHPSFSIPSTDENVILFDPTEVTPFLLENENTLYISAPAIDDSGKDYGVMSFIESLPNEKVTLDFGGDSTYITFPSGTSSDGITDLLGQAYVYLKKIPGVKNAVDKAKNVYKVFKNEALAAANNGAAEVANFVSGTIGQAVCTELSDLVDVSASGFARGCLPANAPESYHVKIPDDAIRIPGFIRDSDGLLVLSSYAYTSNQLSEVYVAADGHAVKYNPSGALTVQYSSGGAFIQDDATNLLITHLDADFQSDVTSTDFSAYVVPSGTSVDTIKNGAYSMSRNHSYSRQFTFHTPIVTGKQHPGG